MKINVNCSAIFFVFLIILSSGNSFANDASSISGSEFAVLTPWNFFEKSTTRFFSSRKDFRQEIAQLNLNFSSLDWKLSGFRLQTVSDFDSIQGEPNRLNFKTKSLSAVVRVEQLSVDQWIERLVDGVLIRVRVQAVCEPIELRQNSAEATASLSYEFSEKNLYAHVDQLDLQWPTGSWSLSAIKCQGSPGFDQKIQQELTTHLQSAEEIKPLLLKTLNEQLQTGIDQVLARLQTPVVLPLKESKLPLEVSFREFKNTDLGVLSYGELRWKKGSSGTVRSLPAVNLGAADHKDPTMLFPNTGLTDLIKAQLESAPKYTRVNMNQFEFFQRVLNSRVIQFFTWPDLFNYSKRSTFELAISKPTSFDIKWKSNGNAQITLGSHAWLQSYRSDRWWNYIVVRAEADGTIQPKISKGKLVLSADLSPKEINITFGDEYSQAFRPNKWLATNLLNDFSTTLLKGKTFSAEIPSLDMGPLGSATADGWNPMGNGLVGIPLELK